MLSFKSLQNIIYSVCDKDKVVDKTTLISDLNLDSISMLDLFNQIDIVFHTEISVDEFIGCKDVNDLLCLIQKKINA